MLAKEIKTGTVVSYNGAPVLINGITVQTPSARGAATLYKFRGRDLVNKQKVDITLKGTESLDEADFERRPVKMMYADTESHARPRSDRLQPVLDSAGRHRGRTSLHHRRPGRHAGPDLQQRVRGTCSCPPPLNCS